MRIAVCEKRTTKALMRIAHANIKGFYMAEAIMAIFLLGVGLLAALALLSRTLNNTISDRNQVIAVMLAQEGAELVRNLRDNSWAGGGYAFFGNSSLPSASSGTCRVDPSSSFTCGASSFRLNLVNKGYYHAAGDSTIFQRRIALAYTGSTAVGYRDGNPVSVANAATGATVLSVVIWGNSFPSPFTSVGIEANCNAGNKCAYAEVKLTNWNK